MEEAGVGLGSNLGDKTGWIKAALAGLDRLPSSRLKMASGLYRTQPVGYLDQDWFINAAAVVETSLSPGDLLAGLLEIESSLGRIRTEKWGPRLIDLDLLYYGRKIISENGLVLPHPHLDRRRFVLAPLAEVAAQWVHPILGLTPGQMLALLPEEGQEVIRL